MATVRRREAPSTESAPKNLRPRRSDVPRARQRIRGLRDHLLPVATLSAGPPRGRARVMAQATAAAYDTGFGSSNFLRSCVAERAIRLRGVAVHNLKQIDLDIPHRQLVVICGLSRSGKTSLALDTLYAEGQRRYIDSFSAYTRQFLERLEKPAADRIEGIPPAVAVTHKN